jgi:peptide/nickel transport system ATP-binding protein
MRELKRTSGAAIILITHDLGVVAEVCDEVAVMYAGEIVERAPAEVLFEAPEHPYTVGLMASIPRLDQRVERLAAIDGVLPDMSAPPIGCRFADRCPFVLEECRAAPPPVVELGNGHWSRCFRTPLEQLVHDPEEARRGPDPGGNRFSDNSMQNPEAT